LRCNFNYDRLYRLYLRNVERKRESDGFDSGVVRVDFGWFGRGGAGEGRFAKTFDARGSNNRTARFSDDCRKTRNAFKPINLERGDRRSDFDVAGLFDFRDFMYQIIC